MPSLDFGIPKRVKRLVPLEFEQKGVLGTCGRFSVPFSLSKGRSRHLEACGEGVGLDPPSRDHACLSREDLS